MLKFKKFPTFSLYKLYSSSSSTFLAPGTGFKGDNFSKDQGRGDVSGCFKHATFIVHFASIITSAPL